MSDVRGAGWAAACTAGGPRTRIADRGADRRFRFIARAPARDPPGRGSVHGSCVRCTERRGSWRIAIFRHVVNVILYNYYSIKPLMHAPEPHRQGQSIEHCISDRSTGAIGAHIWKPAPPGARARVHTTSSLQQSPVTSREPSLYRVARFPASRFVLITEPPPRRVRSPAMGGVTLKGWPSQETHGKF